MRTLPILFLLACSHADSAPKLVSLDLSPAGITGTIDAPEGAVVAKDKWITGGVMITATTPKKYAVSILPLAADIAKDKADCASAVHKNCDLIAETPDSIITKWLQLGKDNYVVDVVVGPKLKCETATLEARIESRAVADSILTTCRSLKLK